MSVRAPIKQISQEPRYFGEPRRIWRGTILSQISKNESLTKRTLVIQLKENFKITEPTFVPFVVSILTTLQEEGFIVQTKKGVITLAHE